MSAGSESELEKWAWEKYHNSSDVADERYVIGFKHAIEVLEARLGEEDFAATYIPLAIAELKRYAGEE